MSADAAPIPNSPGPFPIEIPQTGSSSLWDRISTWASENKGTVYAIAGVTLVVGAGGAIYYLRDSNRDTGAPGAASSKRKKARDRKKAKERAEREAAKDEEKAGKPELMLRGPLPNPDAEPKKASAVSEDELPDVDENSVQSLSEEVYRSI
jgi:import receptor subunit TOM70